MTNKGEDLLKEVLGFLAQNGNPERAEKYRKYFKHEYIAWGVDKDLVMKNAKEIAARPEFTYEDAVELSYNPINIPEYEAKSTGIILVLAKKKHFRKETLKVVEHWFKEGVNNWAHTDFICGDVLSILYKKGFIVPEDLYPWRSATKKFQRRAFPVSFVKLIKHYDNIDLLLRSLEPMMHDPEREVHQGIGWFLKVAWQKWPAEVEAFLMQWKDSCPRLIMQYATEKMSGEGKKEFKKNA